MLNDKQEDQRSQDISLGILQVAIESLVHIKVRLFKDDEQLQNNGLLIITLLFSQVLHLVFHDRQFIFASKNAIQNSLPRIAGDVDT